MPAPDGVNVGSKTENEIPSILDATANLKQTAVKGLTNYLVGKDASVVLLFALLGFLGYYLPVAFRELRDDAKAERAVQEARFEKWTASNERRETELLKLNETTRETLGGKIDRLADRIPHP